MQFQPKSEEECSNFKLLKEGEADFAVKTASDEVSENNNEMIKLSLECFDSEGQKSIVTDYLLDACAFKLRHFCYAIGIGDRYEAGNVQAEDCLAGGGRCLIRHEKDKSGKYPPKNKIGDYIIPEGSKQASAMGPGRPAVRQAPASPIARQTAPAATPQAAAAAANPRIRAWQAFQKLHAGKDADAMANEWRTAMKESFPDQDPKKLSDGQWDAFVKRGFKPIPAPVTAGGPPLDDPTFTDDDIPF